MLARTDIIRDGFTTLEGGVDSGLEAGLLEPNQLSWAVNATMRGGKLTLRPKFMRVPLVFSTEAEQTAFQNGLFQHLATYRTDAGTEYLMAQVDGRSWRIYPKTGAVKEITIAGDPNPSNLMGGWSEQAECFWVFQDGSSGPLIYNGASLRRAEPNEIKVGTVMAYSGGRIWYATNNGRTFRATDLVGGASGTAAYGYRDAVLKETENDFLNEGGDFSVPVGQGITAMRNTAMLDTSLGQGSLQVFTEDGVFSVNAPYDRTAWKSVDYPIQTVAMLGFGAMNQAGTIPVNGDLFYRAPDGIRSLIMAQRQFSTVRSWGNTPMSAEMERIIRYDQRDLLQYGSAANFDSRLLMTCSPAFTESGVYHRGLIALDFMRVGSMQKQLQPSYDGVWTGLRFLQLVQTSTACYAMVLGNAHLLELWEITAQRGYDNDRTPIVWQWETKKLDFDGEVHGKEIHTAEMATEEESGTVNYNLEYRPDDFPCWLPWGQWSRCYSNCTTVYGCGSFVTPFKSGYWPKRIIPPPQEQGLPIGLNALRFNTIQCRGTVTGIATISLFAVKAVPRTDQSKGDWDTAEGECVALQCCTPSIFSFDSDPGDQSYYYSYWYGAGEQLEEPTTPPSPLIPEPEDEDFDGTPDEEEPVIPPDDPDDPPDEPDDPGDPPDEPEEPPSTDPVLQPWGWEPTGYDTFQPMFDGPESPINPGVTHRPYGYNTAGDPPYGIQLATLEQWKDAVWAAFQAYVTESGISPTDATMYWQYSGGSQLRWNAPILFETGDYNLAAYPLEIWVAYHLL